MNRVSSSITVAPDDFSSFFTDSFQQTSDAVDLPTVSAIYGAVAEDAFSPNNYCAFVPVNVSEEQSY